jgi:hypothetical protein
MPIAAAVTKYPFPIAQGSFPAPPKPVSGTSRLNQVAHGSSAQFSPEVGLEPGSQAAHTVYTGDNGAAESVPAIATAGQGGTGPVYAPGSLMKKGK